MELKAISHWEYCRVPGDPAEFSGSIQWQQACRQAVMHAVNRRER